MGPVLIGFALRPCHQTTAKSISVTATSKVANLTVASRVVTSGSGTSVLRRAVRSVPLDLAYD